MKKDKFLSLWELGDFLAFIILIISLVVIFRGADCPDNIDTSTFYGLFVATACKFGVWGIVWAAVAIISFFAIIFLSNKILKKR